jgi:hypothetical protein
MNCQTFSELVSDVAREQMMEAALRSQALAHAGECRPCAVRLKAQQQLTADLGELAQAAKDQTASDAVWESLSAAFDARNVSPVIPSARRWIYAAGAIAAMLLLIFALAWIAVPRRQTPNVQAAIPENSPPAKTIQSSPETIVEPKHDDTVTGVNQKPQVASRRHLSSRHTSTAQISQPKEIATDFIPLTYGNPDLGADAQMVRVELPRSAMASFGLPVNMDRADQRVKADVLLGADGLARAIRFVQ